MVDPIYIIFNLALDCNALDKKKTQDAYEGDCNDYIVVKKGIYSIVSVISCEFILRFNKICTFFINEGSSTKCMCYVHEHYNNDQDSHLFIFDVL